MTTGSINVHRGFRLRGLVGSTERIFDLDHGEHSVGRAPGNDLELAAAGVSRLHAVLRVGKGELVVEDRGSTNGTVVDARRIAARSKVLPGATLCFGPVTFSVQRLHPDESRLALELPRRPPPPRPPRFSSESTTHLGIAEGNSTRAVGPEEDLRFPTGYLRARSVAMTTLYRQIHSVAQGPISVLLHGETGVGKEMIARILHLSSPRRESSFLALNCSAIPSDLLEAELFGIGKAVATGVDPRPGLILSAAGGTLLLDEIGEMPLALQAKLLRVLQEKEIQPVGGRARKIDVRFVSATNADLKQAMDAGRFREDLYYRLAGDVLEVPPLRDCRDDIPALAGHFLEKFSHEIDVRPRGLSIETMRRLTSYEWPGNVRELENEIRRLVYRSADGQIIDSSLLSGSIRPPRHISGDVSDPGELAKSEPGALALAVRVREFEAEVITEALRQCGGNQTRAAELLEMSRNGLLKKMKRLGVDGGKR